MPTWNYAIVQARGRLTVRDNPDWLLQQIAALTDIQETPRPEPWADRMSPDRLTANSI